MAREYPWAQDPWLIARRISGCREAFFFDSGPVGGSRARYSYVGWSPFRTFRRKRPRNFIPVLRRLFSKYRGRKWDELPFFTGGAAGYISYESARVFEKLPVHARDDLGIDAVLLFFIRDLIIFDHAARKCFLIANLIPGQDGGFERALKNAENRMKRLEKIMNARPLGGAGRVQIRGFRPDTAKREFKNIVSRAQKYIEAGDIYQVNLSQRFSFRWRGDPAVIYEALREINPSPFACFIRARGLAVLSVSPERLVRKCGQFCETRPIAGTRPRGRNKNEDEVFRRELIKNPKERAEHIMLVDLERNDLGRVCEPHSVRVSEMMTLEKYSHVTHIVSNVTGRLRKGRDQFDLLRAMFPGGTITGCPKIRSMAIIEELEPFKRHLYTGSIGWIGFDGDMDMNIVIRTLLLKGRRGFLQVGAGIVYDSDPEQEYWETLHKGKALIDALCRHF